MSKKVAISSIGCEKGRSARNSGCHFPHKKAPVPRDKRCALIMDKLNGVGASIRDQGKMILAKLVLSRVL